MAESPHPIGSAFDAAVMQGSLGALVRFRRAIDRLQSRATVLAVLQDIQGAAPQSTDDQRKDSLQFAVAALSNRGAAVSEWHRLVRWLQLVSSTQGGFDGIELLLETATQRREKSARKFRQWLASPDTRSNRKRLSRALAQAQGAAFEASELQALWDVYRADVGRRVREEASEVTGLLAVLQGWSDEWSAAQGLEPVYASQCRRALRSVDSARCLDRRIQQALKFVDDKTVWQGAGLLQSRLRETAQAREQSARDAALMLELPVLPRFGVA